MEILTKSKSDISNELNKSKEDNEELKFQVRMPRGALVVVGNWERGEKGDNGTACT